MKTSIRKPHYWENAKQHLSEHDSVMAGLIARYHGETLSSRGDAFGTLARSISGQQISVKAADSIWKRLETALGVVTPSAMLLLTDEQFRACGFSIQKINYLRNIADYFRIHEKAIAHWHQEDDEVIIRALTSIKGVGRWTAEMFLIFYLLKPNVLPLDDIGLLKAIALHYRKGAHYRDLKKDDYKQIAQVWQPYCSVATWYMWRSLDPLPVEY